MGDYVGMKVTIRTNGTISLTQPQLIKSLLQDLSLAGDKVKPRTTPARSTVILDKGSASPLFDEKKAGWKYRSAIGKLNYLERTSRPDISYAVHQCARFSEDPRECHAEAVKQIGRYLAGTRDQGLVVSPKTRQFDVYCDADFCGNWSKQYAQYDRDTARSRTGYCIMYAGCPVVWASKLQTEISLSTTEAEYVALSTGLREVIPLMQLLQELKEYNYILEAAVPKVNCKAFEDNSGALEMATIHKLRPRTKHINVKYHHFRDYVTRGLIRLFRIDTSEQLADVLTKPLPEELFLRFRKAILGW